MNLIKFKRYKGFLIVSNIFIKLKVKFKNLIVYYSFQYPRILKFKLISNCKNVVGSPIYNQPTLLLGRGTIIFGNGDNVWINNIFLYVVKEKI
jgi:hypothetical protein